MSVFNRTGLIVTRRQPYVDWANSTRATPGLSPDSELIQQPTIYLAPSGFDLPEECIVDEAWEDIFEKELSGWADEDEWPAPRTREMFTRWFDVRLTESVVDLLPGVPLAEVDLDQDNVAAAMHRCAWCGVELPFGTDHVVTVPLAGERFAQRYSRLFQLTVNDRTITAVVSPSDSPAIVERGEIMARACSDRCEQRLAQAIPAGLRRFRPGTARSDRE